MQYSRLFMNKYASLSHLSKPYCITEHGVILNSTFRAKELWHFMVIDNSAQLMFGIRWELQHFEILKKTSKNIFIWNSGRICTSWVRVLYTPSCAVLQHGLSSSIQYTQMPIEERGFHQKLPNRTTSIVFLELGPWARNDLCQRVYRSILELPLLL